MESVIGEYKALRDAERAVRKLEQQGMSIQDVVVADRAQRKWRKPRPSLHLLTHTPGFAVVMRGGLEDIERARALLAVQRHELRLLAEAAARKATQALQTVRSASP